jgi:hypothetical protein
MPQNATFCHTFWRFRHASEGYCEANIGVEDWGSENGTAWGGSWWRISRESKHVEFLLFSGGFGT